MSGPKIKVDAQVNNIQSCSNGYDCKMCADKERGLRFSNIQVQEEDEEAAYYASVSVFCDFRELTRLMLTVPRI